MQTPEVAVSLACSVHSPVRLLRPVSKVNIAGRLEGGHGLGCVVLWRPFIFAPMGRGCKVVSRE